VIDDRPSGHLITLPAPIQAVQARDPLSWRSYYGAPPVTDEAFGIVEIPGASSSPSTAPKAVGPSRGSSSRARRVAFTSAAFSCLAAD